MPYFAHHSGMLQSSLAEAGIVPFHTFLWLLERCDEEGVVGDVRPRLIVKDLSVLSASLFTIEAVEAALQTLQQPDPSSKRKNHEGRRIIPNPEMGSSFIVVNYRYYNEEWAQERRRKKAAKRQRMHRGRNNSKPDVTQASRPVTPRHADVTPSECNLGSEMHAETSADADPETSAQPDAQSSSAHADGDDVAKLVEVLNRIAPQLAPFESATVDQLISGSGGDPLFVAAVACEQQEHFRQAGSVKYLAATLREKRKNGQSFDNPRDYVDWWLRKFARAVAGE